MQPALTMTESPLRSTALDAPELPPRSSLPESKDASSSATARTRTLEVQVFERGGSAIGEARVHGVTSERSILFLGETDAVGKLMLEGANDVRSVLARATGFEPGTAQPTGTATNLRIELMPARYVEVSVVLENGLPAPAGIRVVAYGDDAGDLSALAQDALANHPGSLSAATDANGLAQLGRVVVRSRVSRYCRRRRLHVPGNSARLARRCDRPARRSPGDLGCCVCVCL